jgi:hypothetical protein
MSLKDKHFCSYDRPAVRVETAIEDRAVHYSMKPHFMRKKFTAGYADFTDKKPLYGVAWGSGERYGLERVRPCFGAMQRWIESAADSHPQLRVLRY